MILQINADHPQPRYIDQVVEALEDDGVIAYPTDTVYGIGCSTDSHDGITRLRRLISDIKGEPEHAPLAIICEDLSEISRYAHVDDDAYRLLRRLLPGPYTFILEATKDVPTVMRKERETIGIRVPNHPIPTAIVERLGHPIATTSAMTEDQELIADPWTLEELYEHVLDIIIDGGYVFPEPSTVIDLSGRFPELIREGKGDIEGFEFVDVVEEDE